MKQTKKQTKKVNKNHIIPLKTEKGSYSYQNALFCFIENLLRLFPKMNTCL